MRSVIIGDTKNLNKARSLLYTCYIEHLNWKIFQKNPSGLKIEKEDHGNSIITDDYDSSAVWFSVINKKSDCVACARICLRDTNGQLEVERYKNANKLQKELLEREKEFHIVELNREAVLPEYIEDTKLYFLLLKTVLQYCEEKRYAVLTTSNLQKWVEVYKQILFPRLDGIFKYYESDPRPVEVYLAKPSEISLMLEKINFILKDNIHASKTSCIS